MLNPDAAPEGVVVRGISIIAIREYVKERLDRDRQKEFFQRLPQECSETILTADRDAWYPLETIKRLRAEVAREFNPRDPYRASFDLGLFTSSFEQSDFLQKIMKRLPIRLILNRAASLWRKFYRPGDMSVVEFSEGKAVLELRDFPSDDPLLCPQFAAWFYNAGQERGLENFTVRETLCIHRGDNRCRWEATWEKE